MMKKDESGLTAAKFAALHKINKSTLLYYDEIGLFSPDIKKENGYRYYTYRQSFQLEMILTFRELGMSIDEIKAYLNEPSREALLDVLQDKIRETDAAIKRMKAIKKLLVSREKSLKLLVRTDLSAIEPVEYPEEYLLISPFNEQWTPEVEFMSIMSHASKFHTHRRFNHAFGTLMGPEAFAARRFYEYNGFFTKIEEPIPKKLRAAKGAADLSESSAASDADKPGAAAPSAPELFIKPAGTYLRAFSVGDWENIPGTYERMIEYAREHKLTFSGYAFEEGLNEMAAKNKDEYVTQITIRVHEAGQSRP